MDGILLAIMDTAINWHPNHMIYGRFHHHRRLLTKHQKINKENSCRPLTFWAWLLNFAARWWDVPSPRSVVNFLSQISFHLAFCSIKSWKLNRKPEIVWSGTLSMILTTQVNFLITTIHLQKNLDFLRKAIFFSTTYCKSRIPGTYSGPIPILWWWPDYWQNLGLNTKKFIFLAHTVGRCSPS